MSHAMLVFNVYLQIHLMLAGSFLLFRATRAVYLAVSGRSGFRPLTRVAQALLCLSLLAPMVLAIVPQHTAEPTVRFEAARPLAESGPRLKHVARPAVAPAAQALPKPTLLPSFAAQVRTWIRSMDSKRLARFALWVFLFAFVVALLRLARDWRALRGLVARSLKLRVVGRVTIAATSDAAVPFSTWLAGRAFVIIPEALLTRSRDLNIAIRHELQHHRRGDTAWARLVELAVCGFFANPFIHLWKKEISELQEFSCDEALIGHGKVSSYDYGSCLVRVAEAALGSRSMPVGTACMATSSKNPKHVQSFLHRRVEMFIQHEKIRAHAGAGLVLGTLVALLTLAAAYASQPAVPRAADHRKPNPGEVSFDPAIQNIAENALKKALTDRPAEGGFVIVSEPATGRLLAVANSRKTHAPGVDQKPWALSYLIEPASAIKTVIAASAIERGTTNLDEMHYCEKGHYEWDGHVYGDHSPFDHLTTAGTIIQSSNICGIKIGQTLGSVGVARALSDFGFGPGGTAQSFPGAVSGQFPSPDSMPESEYVPLMATGYADRSTFSVSPLEMVQAYGAIANGGSLMLPISAVQSDSTGTVMRRVLSGATAHDIRSALGRVVTEGTGTHARSSIYTIAGKTSTAYEPDQEPGHHNEGGEIGIAGFVGFAPLNQPRVLVYVGIIRPKSEHPQGGIQSAPVVKMVVEEVLRLWQVAPDQTLPR